MMRRCFLFANFSKRDPEYQKKMLDLDIRKMHKVALQVNQISLAVCAGTAIVFLYKMCESLKSTKQSLDRINNNLDFERLEENGMCRSERPRYYPQYHGYRFYFYPFLFR
jgi:hypothetical protein